MAEPLPRGVIAAACTPFDIDLRPDYARLAGHLATLRAEGCVGVLLAGTTGEGSGLSLADRRAMVEAVATGDEPGWTSFVSTGTPSLEDTAALTRHALDHQAIPVILPPRVEGGSERGVAAWYSSVIDTAVREKERTSSTTFRR